MNAKKKLMSFLFWCVFSYIAVTVSLYLVQRNFMYFPVKSQQSRSLYNAQDMDVVGFNTADDLVLQAWYKPPKKDMPVIVLFHGNASHMGISALKVRRFLDSGYGVFLPAYRGYAGNPGKPHEAGFYEDAKGAITWLLEHGYQEDNIILYGESLGTGVAIEMASKYYTDVKAVILESPYTSFIALAKRTYFWLPVNLLMRDRFENINKISDVSAPVFIINGARDRLVPPYMGRVLYEAAGERKAIKTLPESGHNDMHQNGVDEHILHFLSGLK